MSVAFPSDFRAAANKATVACSVCLTALVLNLRDDTNVFLGLPVEDFSERKLEAILFLVATLSISYFILKLWTFAQSDQQSEYNKIRSERKEFMEELELAKREYQSIADTIKIEAREVPKSFEKLIKQVEYYTERLMPISEKYTGWLNEALPHVHEWERLRELSKSESSFQLRDEGFGYDTLQGIVRDHRKSFKMEAIEELSQNLLQMQETVGMLSQRMSTIKESTAGFKTVISEHRRSTYRGRLDILTTQVFVFFLPIALYLVCAVLFFKVDLNIEIEQWSGPEFRVEMQNSGSRTVKTNA